jgi:hypothetical protein
LRGASRAGLRWKGDSSHDDMIGSISKL